MSRLVRNTTPDGSCKYGLIRLDKIRQMPEEQRKAVSSMIEKLEGIGVVEMAGKGDKEEVFCIKLKDIHAAPALRAYATSCVLFDEELAQDIFGLARRAAVFQGARHPTI